MSGGAYQLYRQREASAGRVPLSVSAWRAKRKLAPAERVQRIAYELIAVAPGASYLLRRAAGLGLDSASGQSLALDRQQPHNPER